MTLPWDFEKSDVWCPRGHGRLVHQIGADDNEGYLSLVRFCLDCSYTEQPQVDRTFRAEMRTALRRLNALHQTEGVLVPMVIDTSPFPEEDWP